MSDYPVNVRVGSHRLREGTRPCGCRSGSCDRHLADHIGGCRCAGCLEFKATPYRMATWFAEHIA